MAFALVVKMVGAVGFEPTSPKAADFKIHALDAQRKKGKNIFGGGLLLSERAAAERAAAERAAAIVWDLSEAERMAVASMGR